MKNFVVHHQVKFQSPYLQSFQTNDSQSLMVWEVFQTWDTTSKGTLNIFYQVDILFQGGRPIQEWRIQEMDEYM